MLTFNIDTHSASPMYEQIYTYIKDEIINGSLPYHYKLPSTRNLAQNLQVSRNTVDMAYAQLVSEGYIETIPKSGYYVLMAADLMHLSKDSSPIPKNAAIPKKKYRYDFSPFAIDSSSFPYNIWRKLSKNCMNEDNHDLFLLGDNQGDESLRNAIARYLHESRGVNCRAGQIIIGAGADYLLQLLSKLLEYIPANHQAEKNPISYPGLSDTNPADPARKPISCFHSESSIAAIAMENPTYKQAYKIFTGMHYDVNPISLDHNGIKIKELSCSGAGIVYVTPSHQYPLGIVMPIKRRMELLQWAESLPNRYIIEDDHDSEFRYKGKPIPALQGIDTGGKVIYLGTFSRAIAPAIRIGYMVLPEILLGIYKQHFYYYSSTVSRLDQNIITHFITDGYFERHLNKMRKLYKGKHDLVIQGLKIFKDSVKITGENAGLHLVLSFQTRASEKELIDAAAKKGIKLYGLSEHFISDIDTRDRLEPDSPSLLFGYANVTEESILKGIPVLYEALKEFL